MSWRNGYLFLRGENRGFVEEGVKTYQLAPMTPINLPTTLLSLHPHSGMKIGMKLALE
jgi:hypothetical protein